MTILNDTQTILLSHASQREGGSLLPVPACIRTPGHTVRRLMSALLDQGLAEERPVRDATLLWREDGDDRFGLFATEAGLAALDSGGAGGEADEDTASAAQEPTSTAGHAKPPARSDSKQSKLLAMLQSESGANIEQLCTGFGWQAHSARAMLTGLRKRGHDVVRTKVDGVTIYRVQA